MLAAEEPSIDRPGTGADHCQCGGKDCQYDAGPGITGLRESDPDLHDGDHTSYHWSPQTDEEQYPRARSNQRWNNCRQIQCSIEMGYSKVDEESSDEQSLEQQAYSGPTLGECRE